MIEQLDQLYQDALTTLETAASTAVLEAWYRDTLGRKGSVQLLTRQVGGLSPEERPAFGKRVNEVKEALQEAYDGRAEHLKLAEIEAAIARDTLDVTLPGRSATHGNLHVATKTLREIYKIWADMGFQVFRSRDVETDEYNFELLNIPQHHPARDMWDTFHTLTPGVILRTHTSPGQIHAMRTYAPEAIRVILPGMCYRYEQITARSEIQFHQVEGLAVGKNITFADLKGTLTSFARRMFGEQRKVRFRANYFPFTEPSAEMDVECILCNGRGCNVCKHSGWLEILGCGMVHPNVLEAAGLDSEKYTGWAFGMGPARIAMSRYDIHDIRLLYDSDVRFLEQFAR